ncbi:MAG: HD domain-containing protein [Dehalococcoidia bacterium]|nr:HD domain-containing protein [Dehalococcoidia bacterium]
MATTHPALAPFIAARSDVSPPAGADDVAGRAASRAGLAACHALTDALDGGLRAIFEESQPAGIAVVAVGGSGRREQCRHSDIDVMMLVARGAEETAKRLLYPLWDTGLKVGHSIRTVEQAVESANRNLETLTALLDARLVAGDSALFEGFVAARQRAIRGQASALARGLAERRDAVVAKEPWQLQAPHLKDGRGALRDVHLVHWLETAAAIAQGLPAPDLDTPLVEARERLLATRNALHALSERPDDVFRADLAPRVAGWLEVDTFEWSRELYLSMREVDAAASARLAPDRRTPRRRWLTWLRGSDPHAEAATASTEERRDVDRLFGALRSVDGLEGEAVPLEPLPREDWLERLLPEWEVLRGRRHIAPFHVHPVDVHVMRTVAEAARATRVDEDSSGTPRAAAALPDASEVLLAALLHDIGKGHEAEHVEAGAVIAERFAARAGLSAEASRRLVSAVALHLLLPTVATRRDIADERVIRETAERVGDAHTLHLLYVLSVADARATGPDVWNEWKAQLMRSLYTRVLDVLSAESPDAVTAPEARLPRVVDALRARFPAETVEAHVRQMDPGYLLSTPPDAIGDHIALVAQAEQTAGRTAVHRGRTGRLDRLTVATPDRPGLLQAVAGVLVGHNASVLSGVAHTRADGVAIQVWHVEDGLGVGIDERRWSRILGAVPQALAGEYPTAERLAEVRRTYGAQARAELPTVVHVENGASDRYSVLEVTTADRLGLLYAITHTLHEMDIDIHLAKVDTIGPEVVDAFYVRRANGRRLEEADEVERVEGRVVAAIEALDAE